jgi:hypothetical protein
MPCIQKEHLSLNLLSHCHQGNNQCAEWRLSKTVSEIFIYGLDKEFNSILKKTMELMMEL